ncbi:hypothetical protein DNHGIG_00420 [Collibacillus ludicampi]|uniref:Uncharacterized protein n=1 Tax=Collibacillus ludicampi TaxID=2771369 RepID=A0AAV4LA15_9BACL|nr:hypothetical protein [Collibacillus ludicampi]GIM44493.1 hypothetical protein DNHGIG_00420 [Collibacillus ludicampi]
MSLIRQLLIRELMLKHIERELQSSQSWTKGVFESLQKRVSDELIQVRRQMHRSGTFIMEKQWKKQDVFIQFKWNNKVFEVPYTLPMLEAEALGRLEHMLD